MEFEIDRNRFHLPPRQTNIPFFDREGKSFAVGKNLLIIDRKPDKNLAVMSRDNRTAKDSGKFWQNLANSGKFWQILANSGRICQNLPEMSCPGTPGQPKVLAKSGRFAGYVMSRDNRTAKDSGKFWQILAEFARICQILPEFARICQIEVKNATTGNRTRDKKGPAIRIGAEYGTLSQNGYGEHNCRKIT